MPSHVSTPLPDSTIACTTREDSADAESAPPQVGEEWTHYNSDGKHKNGTLKEISEVVGFELRHVQAEQR